uniref:Ribonuclease H protein At1g65750 family n=1 Tax=Cajanus cajan TaxID=3821 RepID=A0A151QRL3_CAJCA|nr:Putative ribonuclease H protein At1g65750 family [Cajanus cajan]
MRITTNLGRYLGFSLPNGRPQRRDFLHILEKTNQRLAAWKLKLLNRAGKLCLIKSVVSSLLVYSMQVNWLPKGLCSDLEKSMRRFLWANKDRFQALVGWDLVTTDKGVGGLGIKDLRLMNLALLGKLIWSMLHDHDKPWVEVLSSKYLKGDSILNAKIPSSSSPAWHSILLALQELRDGFLPKLNDGRSSLWYKDWTGLGCLCKLVDYVHISDTHLKVLDVYTDDSWNFNCLRTQLPSQLLDQLSSFPGPSNISAQDCFVWSASTSGVYSTRSAYALLKGTTNDTIQWRKVWKSKLPEKIKFLLWLLLHQALPTNVFRNHCNLQDSPYFSRCSGNIETILHCIRVCPYSRELWTRLDLAQINDFHILDPVAWIFQQLSAKDKELRMLTIWWAWHWRNNMLLDFSFCSVNYVVRCIYLDPLNLRLSLSSDFQLTPTLFPLDSSTIRLNVDGCWFSDQSRLGFGGLIWDVSGRWLAGFSGNCSHGDPSLAELLAVLDGLKIT